MSLIPKSELTTLKSAEEVRAVADTAEFEHELMAVAHAINTAANTGEYSVTLNTKLSEDVQKELQAQGFKVEDAYPAACPGRTWIISWGDSIE